MTAPETLCMSDEEQARWAQLRTEAVAAAEALRALRRAHEEVLTDNACHQLGEAADLLDIFGQPIVVMTPDESSERPS